MIFIPSFTLVSILSLSVALPATAKVLPIVGPHHFDVSITAASLTDNGRIDPFAKDKTPRKLMLSIYNPVPKCLKKSLQPYMPASAAAFMDAKFGAYGLPNGSFPALQLETCISSARSKRKSDYPLVLFSPALGTSRLLYSSTLHSLASAGYQIVSIDHPYDADFVQFPDGTTVQGIDISDDEIDSALATRVDDIAFVQRHYTQGCKPKPALLGHSLGGAAAASSLLAHPSLFAGAVNLDGSMFGPILTTNTSLNQPFMLMGHDNKTQDTDPSWKSVWLRLSGWKREFEVRGAQHYGFSDLPLVIDVLGLRKDLPEVGQLLGDIEGNRMLDLTVSYVTAFLDMVMKGKKAGFERLERKFEEVVLRDE
jgi:pimeloyl-ACP methyl ester carboxylesterase